MLLQQIPPICCLSVCLRESPPQRADRPPLQGVQGQYLERMEAVWDQGTHREKACPS